MISIIF